MTPYPSEVPIPVYYSISSTLCIISREVTVELAAPSVVNMTVAFL